MKKKITNISISFMVLFSVMVAIPLAVGIQAQGDESTFVYHFVEGWNSFTIPLEVENNTFGYLFGDVLYNGNDGYLEHSVFYWNTSGPWYTSISEDGRLYPGIGYSVYSYANFSHSISGNPISEDLSIDLVPLHNFVGWIHEETVTAEDIYNSVTGCAKVSKLINASQQNNFLEYSPDVPKNNFDITQGMGFWISVNQSSVWDGSVLEEETEPKLEVSIDTGFGLLFDSVNAYVENTGDAVASNINLSIYVEYGFLGHKVNSSVEFSVLEPDVVSDTLEIKDLRGFGPITVTAKAFADDVETVETTASGWIIGRFIILIS